MRLKDQITTTLEESAVRTYARSAVARFSIAFLVVLASNVVRLPLIPWIGNPLPTLFVSPAIVVITWFCGVGPGLFAVLLSFLSVSFLWMDPHFSLDISMDQDWLAMLLFTGTTTFLAFFTEMTRNALALQKNTRDHLETMVEERTAHLQETIGELQAFSYTVSHDLRSPLRAMQGFASIVAEENAAKLDPLSRTYLHRISAAASRLDGLISDLLAFTNIGHHNISLISVRLEDLLADIFEQYPSLQTSNARFEMERPLLPVKAHPPYLTQVLANLLDNAIKFVPPHVKPEVRIWTEPVRNGESVRVSIRDNGVGIPADQISKIFNVFQRVDTDKEGTGIGLSIVKKAIEKMGGTVGVNSEPGLGSTFWVELPADHIRLSHHPGVSLGYDCASAGAP